MDLVTGGLGFIGNELVRQLKVYTKVHILDNGSRIAPDIDDLRHIPIIEVDITDFHRVRNVFETLRPRRVFHLAAIHYIPECNANPEKTLRTNVEATLGLLRISAEYGVEHFIFTSSGAVYADSPDILTEDSTVAPVDIYGLSKLFGEQVCQLVSRQTGLPVTICRLFNNYGPRETNAHIIPEIFSQLKKGNTLRLGNIDTKRDYIFTSDTAAALIEISKGPPRNMQILNISTGHSVSVKDLVEKIAKIFKTDIKIVQDPARLRKSDKLDQRGSNDRLKKVTGFCPQIDLDKGLRYLLEYEKLL
ncbi:NAD-dependent epimerase/dehydratase family protein [candidate division KSB1 bacterium]|nr:NAD-dependent epimerase/dehydratase family protein [candidate division KSB1 bacterium]